MVKRSADDDWRTASPAKRARHHAHDRLTQLTDELLLRVLSYLPVSTLALCQRLSWRLCAIAGDSQLWKSLYYDRFVRPRAAQSRRMTNAALASGYVLSHPRLGRWLDEDNLVRLGKETDWKRQYKIRHNWARGRCAVNAIEVAEQPTIPPLLVRFQHGVVLTADPVGGLRAWSTEGHGKLLARAELDRENAPISMAVELGSKGARRAGLRIALGLSTGGFCIYALDLNRTSLTRLYSHPGSSNGGITAIAYCSSYLLTMAASRLMSLYELAHEPGGPELARPLNDPRLLHSLRSHTTWPTLSLALRIVRRNIIASVAFACPAYPFGWSVGVQEISLSENGALVESRLASSETPGGPALIPPPTLVRHRSSLPTMTGRSYEYSAAARCRPTSLSYTHPYLLVSHPDNTLTLYLVTSTASSLKIGPGRTLWGHTSSVSGAHVGGRGKAVSVSSRGDELRIWELEGHAPSSATRRRCADDEGSIRIRPERSTTAECGNLALVSDAIARRGSGLGLAFDHTVDEALTIRGNWVGFDEENVVVLKENRRGRQALMVYDFT